MRRCTMAFTVAAIGLAVVSAGMPASAAPPSASFNRSCTVGGDTVVSWKHAHVISLDLAWFDSDGVPVATGQARPHGLKFSTPTPAGVDVGGSVEVGLDFHDGTGARLQPATCT
jgi:hypothetical protein